MCVFCWPRLDGMFRERCLFFLLCLDVAVVHLLTLSPTCSRAVPGVRGGGSHPSWLRRSRNVNRPRSRARAPKARCALGRASTWPGQLMTCSPVMKLFRCHKRLSSWWTHSNYHCGLMALWSHSTRLCNTLFLCDLCICLASELFD